jgi:hypothetical protein
VSAAARPAGTSGATATVAEQATMARRGAVGRRRTTSIPFVNALSGTSSRGEALQAFGRTSGRGPNGAPPDACVVPVSRFRLDVDGGSRGGRVVSVRSRARSDPQAEMDKVRSASGHEVVNLCAG